MIARSVNVSGMAVSSGSSARSWTWWLFRAVAGVEVVLASAEAVFAGGFLAGH